MDVWVYTQKWGKKNTQRQKCLKSKENFEIHGTCQADTG